MATAATTSPETVAASQGSSKQHRNGWPALAAIFAYAAMLLAAIHHHEPWADEAQAWLLARDSSLWQLWTHLLHYEGAPGLWQTLVHLLIAAGLPYRAFSYLPVPFACTAAWLVMRRSPFPLAIRLALPFTFFPGYQYAVISRSYCLLPFLIFGLAVIYPRAENRPRVFALLLALTSMVSAHAMILAACVAASFLVFRWRTLNSRERRELAWALAGCSAIVGLAAWAAIPARDVTFVTHPKLSLSNWYIFTSYTLRETFTGEALSAALAVFLTLPLLWRGRALLFFGVAVLLLTAFGAIVYAAVWHQGTIFLAWLFALWISLDSQPRPGRIVRSLAWGGMSVVMTVQFYWTCASMAYDWTQSYSAGGDVARFLQSQRIAPDSLYRAGYATTAAMPYLPKTSEPAYWDWSVRNRQNDMAELIASHGRDHVLVGYKLPQDQKQWARWLQISGYELEKSFTGHLFWHDRTYEEESFDLYRWHPTPANLPRFSKIAMNDPAAANQLIAGFYQVEANSWRWTAKSFSALFATPENAARDGAELLVQLFIPDMQAQILGPLTLTATLNGELLAEQTYAKPGRTEYRVPVPNRLLAGQPICIRFELDKSRKPETGDARELGVIVTGMELRRASMSSLTRANP